jgi:hypothetical protein
MLKHQWPVPSRWEDFEDLCYHLSLATKTLVSAMKYGRRGQSQYGLDIAGTTADSRTEWKAIQCKLKTEYLGGQLGEKEIYAEYEKSKKFRPPLFHLIFATTCARDRAVQDVINAINSSALRRHTVEVWFWDDIVEKLDNYPKVAERFYPAFFPESVLHKSHDGSITTHLFEDVTQRRKRLSAFNNDLFFRKKLGPAAGDVASVILEQVDNCFGSGKGKASRVSLEFDGREIRVSDDGVTFDPFDESFMPSEGQLGLKAIRMIRDHPEHFEARYEPRDIENGVNTNRLVLRVLKDFGEGLVGTCVAYGDVGLLHDRAAAVDFAESIDIPPHCDPFVLRLGGSLDVSASSSHQLIIQIGQRLGRRKLKVIIDGQRNNLFKLLTDIPPLLGGLEIEQDG